MEERILDHFGEFEQGSRIVAAKHFFLESEAYLYAARLREAGIPHYISNANIMTAIPLGGGGGIGLHVRENDLAEASRIIARLDYQQSRQLDEDYRNADEDEIEYLRDLHGAAPEEQSPSSKYIYWGIIAVIVLLIIRAFLRAAGLVESWRDYF
jgi:hypothetical protein